MRVSFETAYRILIGLMMTLLLWSVWASGQTVPAPASPLLGLKPGMMLSSAKGALTFGLDKVELFQPDLFQHPLWQYLASLIYLALAFGVAKAADFLLCNRLKAWAAKAPSEIKELLFELMHGPFQVITFIGLIHLGLRVLAPWPDWVGITCTMLLHILLAVTIAFMAVRGIDFAINNWRERAAAGGDRSFDEMLFPVVRKSLKVFVVLVVVLVTSDNLGLNIKGALASLSIGGLALGLAAQDTLANFFGALSVFVDKPFRLGDRIKMDVVDGTVEGIGLRSTRVRSLDGYLVTIPNKTMGNSTITNISRRPTIKTEMNLGIVYEISVEKVQLALTILNEIYRANPKTADLLVSFNKFGESSLNIVVVHWWGSTDYREYLAGMQAFNLEIKRRFDLAGIEFAYPSETHYVKQVG